MRLLECPSPNHSPRPGAGTVDMLILHYTGMRSAAEALDRLCSADSQVSAHYLIDEDGSAWRLVPEERRAWHAGLAFWAGRRDINSASIGIELVNPGHEFGYRRFPAAQMAALAEMARGILGRHPIPPHFVLGHSDVAPQRKQDPGELFDWPGLAQAGIGFFPDFAAVPAMADGIGEAQRRLAAIGYDVPLSGALDEATRGVITAFQRHFRPACCDGALDGETEARIAALAAALETA